MHFTILLEFSLLCNLLRQTLVFKRITYILQEEEGEWTKKRRSPCEMCASAGGTKHNIAEKMCVCVNCKKVTGGIYSKSQMGSVLSRA